MLLRDRVGWPNGNAAAFTTQGSATARLEVEIDKILYQLIDIRKSREAILNMGFKEADVDRIIRLIKGSEFKRKLPPIAKLSDRTVGLDFLYPFDRDR